MGTDGFSVLQREGIYGTLMIHKYALCKSNHKASIIRGAIAATSVVNLLLFWEGILIFPFITSQNTSAGWH